MSTLQWPAGWYPRQFDLGILRNVVQFRNPLTSDVQSMDLLLWRWVATLVMNDEHSAAAVAGEQEAFFNQLVGGINNVALWHFGRPVPVGTLRGAPTVLAAVDQLANEFTLTGCTPGSTLRAGDMLGLHTQLLQVAAPCVANAGGQMVVTTVNRLRSGIDAGEVAVWDKPKALFAIPESSSRFSHSGGIMSGTSWELQEVFAL